MSTGRKRPPARNFTDDGEGVSLKAPARGPTQFATAASNKCTQEEIDEEIKAQAKASTFAVREPSHFATTTSGGNNNRRTSQEELDEDIKAKAKAGRHTASGAAAASYPKIAQATQDDYYTDSSAAAKGKSWKHQPDRLDEDRDHPDFAAKKKAAKTRGKKDAAAMMGLYGSNDEEQQQLQASMASHPGAVSIPGASHGQHRPDSLVYGTHDGGDSVQAHASPRRQDENLVSAFLVDEEADNRGQQDDSNLPPRVAAKAVEYKPWYKRKPVLIALALLLVGVVGTVLGVTLRDTGDGETVFESESPTSSPAPTAIAAITVVVQLDEMPAETGWQLECDGTKIQSVPEGSYSFLPIGLLIPSFRLEITEEVVTGSECVYTITDGGGDGLIGGFFEVYYGDDVGVDANRIARGVPLSFVQSVVFTVEPPETAAPTVPTSPTPDTPAPTPPTFLQTCSVCPDGSPVPNPDIILESGMTCGELDSMAGSVFNQSQCVEFEQMATACACENFCDTLCPDGSLVDESQEDTLVRVDNGIPVTCGDIQDQVMVRDSSPSDCNTASFLGEEICNCPSEGNFCRICEPGGPNRLPTNLSREIIPGVSCEDISGIAFTLLTSDPLFGVICPACLSIGAYCGCPVVENPRTFCRLCGGTNLLPEPDRLVFSPQLEINTTCFHVEFFSNLGIAPNGTTSVIPDCSVVQEQNAAECCAA